MLLLAGNQFLYCFSELTLRWSRKIAPSKNKTDYQHHCPRKVPASLHKSNMTLSIIFYILGPFSQDNHHDLEPAPQGSILSGFSPFFFLEAFVLSPCKYAFDLVSENYFRWWDGSSQEALWGSEKKVVHIGLESLLYIFSHDTRATMMIVQALISSHHSSIFQVDRKLADLNYKVLLFTGWYMSALVITYYLAWMST